LTIMPVQIGTTTHSFSDPTGLLSDCHRRIEMFLGVLQTVAENVEVPLTVTPVRHSIQRCVTFGRLPRNTLPMKSNLFSLASANLMVPR
jgi:hypothetical protein